MIDRVDKELEPKGWNNTWQNEPKMAPGTRLVEKVQIIARIQGSASRKSKRGWQVCLR